MCKYTRALLIHIHFYISVNAEHDYMYYRLHHTTIRFTLHSLYGVRLVVILYGVMCREAYFLPRGEWFYNKIIECAEWGSVWLPIYKKKYWKIHMCESQCSLKVISFFFCSFHILLLWLCINVYVWLDESDGFGSDEWMITP